MKGNRPTHFRNFSHRKKINLLIAVLITFYVLFIVNNLSSGQFCEYIGFDYCAYWTGGRLMNDESIADVYNMDLLTRYQEKVYPPVSSNGEAFSVVPLPYLPVFVLIFQLLSFIDLPYSFLVWTLLNFFGFILYLRFFIKETTQKKLSTTVMAMILISLPVFLNLFYGQVNFFLGVCAGEFFRALMKSKHVKAGLWLGGWLFKPQLLILVLPFLLIKKNWKVILGFAISFLSVFVLSYGLIGKDGLLDLFNIITNSSQGGAASNPQFMMNWRMVGLYLAYFIHRNIGWGAIITGSLGTIIITFLVFLRKKTGEESVSMSIRWLGLLAATCVVTWHAHLSMAVVLIPFLLYLLMREEIDRKLFDWWVVAPIILFFFKFSFNILAYVWELPEAIYTLPSMFEALSGFVFNLIFLGWSVQHYRVLKSESENTSIGLV